MKPETFRSITAYLPGRDQQAMNPASRQVSALMQPHTRAMQLARDDVPGVQTLEGFCAVLGTPGPAQAQARVQPQPGSISALPSEVRAQPLAALAGRIMALPPLDRGAAIAHFLAQNLADGNANAHTRLTELRTAAGLGWMALAQREIQLVRPGAAAHAAVVGGANVRTVARNLGISGQEAIATLEGIAMFDAQDAVQRGEPAAQAAHRLGITTAPNLQALQNHAMNHHALPAVSRGEDPAAVAQRMGITDPAQLAQLSSQAATGAVTRGQDVAEAVRRFGIEDPAQIQALETKALDQHRAQALRAMPNVRQAAQHLGIESPTAIQVFKPQAVNTLGLQALQQGRPLPTVREHLGPQFQPSLDRLAQHAGQLELLDAKPAANKPRLG